MTTTASEKFVVYWLGYHLNPPAIQSMFGIGGDPWRTQLPVTQAVAVWEPAKGNKGGMMEYNINDDTSYQAANAIIKALSTQARTAD